MSKVVSPISAVVEFITGIKQGQYGPYCSVLFKDQAGEKIWKSFDPDAEELLILKKGIWVQLIPAGERNGKVSHNIVVTDAPAATKTQPVTHQTQALPPAMGWNVEEKRAIANKVEQHADLLAYCLQVSKAKFADTGLVESEESIRTLATTLFIQSVRG